jgi:hypothetical protein
VTSSHPAQKGVSESSLFISRKADIDVTVVPLAEFSGGVRYGFHRRYANSPLWAAKLSLSRVVPAYVPLPSGRLARGSVRLQQCSGRAVWSVPLLAKDLLDAGPHVAALEIDRRLPEGMLEIGHDGRRVHS